MAKIKDWELERKKLEQEVKDLRANWNKCSIYDEHGFVMLNTVKWKKDIEEIIKRKEQMVMFGPFILTEKEV